MLILHEHSRPRSVSDFGIVQLNEHSLTFHVFGSCFIMLADFLLIVFVHINVCVCTCLCVCVCVCLRACVYVILDSIATLTLYFLFCTVTVNCTIPEW